MPVLAAGVSDHRLRRFSSLPDAEAKTMILRFRDLVTPPGGTIEAHREVLAGKGHVWWGWWSKAGERVPSDIFGNLKGRARRGDGLDLLLFDSGRLLLYRARCTDIYWDPAGEEQEAPDDGDATPDYYRTQANLAWFKLDEIPADPLGAPDAVLRLNTYVKVDEFFTSGSSRYTSFYGKKVVSREELRQQDRSIWFVRDSQLTDPDNAIELLNASTLSPSHFPSDFFQTESNRLLWLSDIHFGNQNFPLKSDAYSRNLAMRIESAIGENPDLAGIIVSGDLTWRADLMEYAHAHTFLNELTSLTRVAEPYQIAICPGNHDLRFSADPANKGARIQETREESRRNYSQLYNMLYYLQPNDYLSCGRKFLLGGTVPVEFVYLNSSLLEQTEHEFQGYGFVGEAQLEDAARQMGWVDNQLHHPLRIVVVHHHILPVTFREAPVAGVPYSVLLDAEALVRWIVKHRVKVVLHGHMHNPFYSAVTRAERFTSDEGNEHTFHILGMGSTGVAESHFGEVRSNMFGLLDFSQHSLRVTYRSIHPTDASDDLQSVIIDLSE